MKKKFLRVTMPDGSKWDVPAEMIAESRASYYHHCATYEFRDEVRFVLAHNTELTDWAENNMNWKYVAPHAVQVSAPNGVDYQEGWVNGEKEVVEHE